MLVFHNVYRCNILSQLSTSLYFHLKLRGFLFYPVLFAVKKKMPHEPQPELKHHPELPFCSRVSA